MVRLFLPLILVAAAIGLFVLYTNPAYQNIKSLSAQNDSYNYALDKAQELRTVRDQLLQKRNSFSTDDVDKLQDLLPDNVDNIRLVIDLNNIAARHGLSLAGINIGDESGADQTQTQDTTTDTSSGPTGSVDLSFTVAVGDYNTLLAFIQDLEHSLRIIDITQLSFSAPTVAGDPTTYTMTVRTYWLK